MALQLIVVPSLDFNLADLRQVLSTGVGGVLFLGDAPAPRDLALSVAQANVASGTGVPLLVMADEEGGGVQRLRPLVESVPWARAMTVGMTPEQVSALAERVGSEMRSAGVDVNLAPVLDVDAGAGPDARNPDGQRSFSGSPAIVTSYGLAFLRGLRQAGVIPVVKHFPGLGGSSGNTDVGPASTQPISVLRSSGLLPFRAAIDAGAPAVMVSNAAVPGLTSSPASLSRAVIQGLLRDELGFGGLVVTDSLSAGAVRAAGYDVPAATVAAVEAGADMVLFGSTLTPGDVALLRPSAVASTAAAAAGAVVNSVNGDSLPTARLVDAVRRVLAAKGLAVCSN